MDRAKRLAMFNDDDESDGPSFQVSSPRPAMYPLLTQSRRQNRHAEQAFGPAQTFTVYRQYSEEI